jgi:hypothetical protein
MKQTDSFKLISAIDECRIRTFKTIMDVLNNEIKIRYANHLKKFVQIFLV